MEAYRHWRSLQFDGKDIEVFTLQYTHALCHLEAFGVNIDAELKVYEFIDRGAPFYIEWANIVALASHSQLQCTALPLVIPIGFSIRDLASPPT
jgi:hypothetical protein